MCLKPHSLAYFASYSPEQVAPESASATICIAGLKEKPFKAQSTFASLFTSISSKMHKLRISAPSSQTYAGVGISLNFIFLLFFA